MASKKKVARLKKKYESSRKKQAKTTKWIPRVIYVVKKTKYEFLLKTTGLTKVDAADVIDNIFGKDQVKIKAGFKRVRA